MSIDIYLKPEKGTFKITKEELINKLSKEFEIIEIFSTDSDMVDDFEIKPKHLNNPENITYTFHQQPEGFLWHPAPGRSSESIALGVEVLELVSKLLKLKIDYPL